MKFSTGTINKLKNNLNYPSTLLLTMLFFTSVASFSLQAEPSSPQTTAASSSTQATPSNPEGALKRLMEGNKRFTQDKTICPERNQVRRDATVNVQKPFAIILGCSDSRVPPEIAFDQGIGDVFVVRVAGNIVSPVELDSVEYSVIANDSSLIVVLGHENCGAVSAVLQNKTTDVEAIADPIRAGLKRFNPENKTLTLNEAIEDNIKNSVMLIKQSPTIDRYVRAGKLKIVGAYYDLKTGAVRLLEPDLKTNSNSKP